MHRPKEEKKEESYLKKLCGDDIKLYDCLANFLYEHPLQMISKENLDLLVEEAEKSGKAGAALDKAVFEAGQNPGERERYINIIQTLTSKSLPAARQEKEKAEKEGLTDMAASLGRRIEHQKLISERAEDVINIASKFYNEKLIATGEDARREARAKEILSAEREDSEINEQEKADREVSKLKRKGMRRKERKEAKKRDQMEELSSMERKEARVKERQAAEREDSKIDEQEKADRETRRNGGV
jgi:hypothetical protein